MEQIYLFLDTLVNVVDLYIVYTLYGILLRKKDIPKYLFIIAFLFCGALLFVFTRYMNINEPIILIVNFIFMFTLTFLYEGKTVYRVIMTAVFFALGTISEIFGFFIYTITDTIISGVELSQEISTILIILISRFFLFPLVKIVNSMKKHKDHNIKIRYYISILMVPALSIFLLHFTISNNMDDNGDITLSALIPIICILIIVFCTTYLFENILDKFELERKSFHLNRELKNQQTNYEKTSLLFKNISKIVHDTNYHLQYISACVKEQKQEEALKYIEKTLDIVNSSMIIVNSGNLLIDTFLSNAIGIAKEFKIKVSYEISLNNKDISAIEIFDLCIILGNALDNALEACKKVPVLEERLMRIKITAEKDNLTIKLENSTDGNIKTEKGRFFSQKQSKTVLHGLGLENTHNTVNKYNGEMLVEIRGKKFYFGVFLPLS